MNELDFRILIEKRLLIVPDQSKSMMVTPIDRKLRDALNVELARNFGIWLKDDIGITAEFVMDFFRWLKNRGKLISQPYFPNLLPVSQVLSSDLLIKKPGCAVSTITYGDFKEKIVKNRKPDSLEFLWLERYFESDQSPMRVLSGFLSKHLNKGKIRAGRKERRQFMIQLEEIEDYFYKYPLEMIDFWKKVALWIHPSDYPDLPDAQRFLFHVLEPEKKKEPEKPKLKKLMWKGWKEGKDFDVFESYIDQAGLTPRELLISLRDYERCPRVSRWKKTEGVELGKEKVGEEEIEVVDLMLLQLKEKLLGMLKLKKANLKIPFYFYKIPAHFILKFPLTIANGILSEEIVSFRITTSKAVHLSSYNMEGESCGNETWELENISDFLITGYQARGWYDTKLLIKFSGSRGETIRQSEINVNEAVNSLILFGYESSSRTLKWIGEPSKTFYAGRVFGIDNWNKVWEITMERKPILSLGEMAEKMYNTSESPTEELTTERIRIDLGL